MQISRTPLVVCAALVGVLAWSLHVQGDDTEAQAKARAALRQKMNEAQAAPVQPPPAAPAAPAPAQPKPAPVAPAPAAAPAVQPAPVAVQLPPSADPAVIERAREAVRQKMGETQPKLPVATVPAPAPVKPVPTPVAQPAPAPAAQPVPAPVAQPAAPVVQVPPAADPEAVAKAREALRKNMSELEGQPPVVARYRRSRRSCDAGSGRAARSAPVARLPLPRLSRFRPRRTRSGCQSARSVAEKDERA
jgi:hypothetical protein